MNIRVNFWDSFVNLLSGIGVVGKDKSASGTYLYVPIDPSQLEAAYRTDWIARKIIDIPAFDSTRAWRNWQAEDKQIEQLEEAEANFNLQFKLQQALIKARLYGGAAMIMGVDQGKSDEELDLETVGKDSLKFIHVVSRHEINAGPMEQDILSEFYGEPQFYERLGVAGVLPEQPFTRIHPSRVVRLVGAEIPDACKAGDPWGDPVLQVVEDAVKSAGVVQQTIAALIQEGKIDIFRVPQLTELLSTQEGTDRVVRRFSLANAAKSVINAVLMDKEEEWDRKEVTFTGMPEVLQMYLLTASGAADIPATRLLGQSPAGMNSTGESDIRNYYDRLAADQAIKLTPALRRLDEVLIRSTLGSRDENIFYLWNSLWQMDETQKAALEKSRSETVKSDFDTGLIPFHALSLARQNMLIESGFYPGLEDALEEAEQLAEQNPDDPNFQAGLPEPVMGIDPETGLPVKVDPAAAVDPRSKDKVVLFKKKGEEEEVPPKKKKAIGDYLLDSQQQEPPGITAAERQAVLHFANNGFAVINDGLRSSGRVAYSEGDPLSWQAVGDLDDLFDRASLPEDIVAYRKVSDSVYKEMLKRNGQQFIDKGYVSLYESDTPSSVKGYRTVPVKVKKKKRALRIAHMTRNRDREVLLDRNSAFKVEVTNRAVILHVV